MRKNDAVISRIKDELKEKFSPKKLVSKFDSDSQEYVIMVDRKTIRRKDFAEWSVRLLDDVRKMNINLVFTSHIPVETLTEYKKVGIYSEMLKTIWSSFEKLEKVDVKLEFVSENVSGDYGWNKFLVKSQMKTQNKIATNDFGLNRVEVKKVINTELTTIKFQRDFAVAA
jgi:hypothetical protein